MSSLPKVSQLVGAMAGTQTQFPLPLNPIFSSLCSSHRQPFLEYQKYHRVIYLFKQQLFIEYLLNVRQCCVQGIQ